MTIFQWDPLFETGLDLVDEHHRHLFELTNQLGACLTREDGINPAEIADLLEELSRYASYHFAEEERLMRDGRVDEAHTSLHRAEHAHFFRTLSQLQTHPSEDKHGAAPELLNYLMNWLVSHILGVDQALSRQLKAIRNGLSPAEALAQEEVPAGDPANRLLLRSLTRLYGIIADRNHRLVTLNESLEAKVVERTCSLDQANQSLHHQQQELRINETRLNRAFEVLNAGICETDLATGTSYLSARYGEILGHVEPEFVWDYESFLRQVAAEDRDRVERTLGTAFLEQRDWDVECCLVRTDGDLRWVRAIGHFFQDESGKMARRVGVLVDITDHRLLDQALQESRERLAVAAKANRIGIWDWNLVTQSLEWDDTVFDLYGRSRTDFAGVYEAWKASVHPDDLAGTEEALNRSIASESTFDQDFRIILPNGTVRHLHARAVVFRNQEGQAVRLLGTNFDVTDRKEAQQKLESLTALHNTIFQAAPIGISAYEATTGRCIMANGELAKILGAEPVQILAQNFKRIPSWKASGLLSAAEATLATREPRIVECQVLTTFGKRLWIQATFAAFLDQGENHLLMLLKDITERKSAEQARTEAIRELEQALVEVKALSGLLPICSQCKKIRDDQGYWSQIEHYIATHSAATFTHGICPDCADELFPGRRQRRGQ